MSSSTTSIETLIHAGDDNSALAAARVEAAKRLGGPAELVSCTRADRGDGEQWFTTTWRSLPPAAAAAPVRRKPKAAPKRRAKR
jgi:hypothetical protein